MPRYDFICDTCGEELEVSTPAENRERIIVNCRNGHKMRRAMTVPMAVIWTGAFHDPWAQKQDRDGLGSTW